MNMDTESEMKQIGVSHPSVVERYFTARYKTCKNGEDMCILTHSNKISILTLAPSHPILKGNKTVSKVDFQINKDTNRLENKVVGKGKKGGQTLTPSAAVCHISCSDQTVYNINACIKGNLIEVNKNLTTSPQLITKKPSTDGYIAIILCRLQDHQSEMDKLMSQEQYTNYYTEGPIEKT